MAKYCIIVDMHCECSCFRYKWLTAADKDGNFIKLHSLCKAKAASEAPLGRTIYGVHLQDGEMVLDVIYIPRVINTTLKPEGSPPPMWRKELRDLQAQWLHMCRKDREIRESTVDDYW